MRIIPMEISSDDDLARRVIGYGRNLAPCLDELEGDDREEVLAVLKGVAGVVAGRVAGLKSKTAGDWSWTFFSDAEMGSVFGVDDRATLARLCGASATGSTGPLGSFPDPDTAWRT